MAELKAGVAGTYYPPFPVLGLASDGDQIFLTGGGGGATASKEVPNVVQAMKYDEETGKLNTIASLGTEKQVVIYISFAPANSLWLASSLDSCKVLQLSEEENTLTEVCSFATETEGKEKTQTVAKYSPAGDMIATGGTDGAVKIWKMPSPPSAPTLLKSCGQEKEILDIDWSPDGKLLASSDRSGAGHIWDVSSGEEKARIKYPVPGQKVDLAVRGVRFIKGGEKGPILVVSASAPRGPAYIALLSGTDGTKLQEIKLDTKTPMTAMDVNRDQTHVAVNMVDGTKRVYSLPGLKLITKSKEVHELPAPCCAFLGKATTVSGSGDRSLNLLSFGGGGAAGACVYMLAILITLLLVMCMVLRIGAKGAALGQGEL